MSRKAHVKNRLHGCLTGMDRAAGQEANRRSGAVAPADQNKVDVPPLVN
jgi:hypothetical protein